MHAVPEGSKVTRYQSCVQVQKSGVTPVEFDQAPELPPECSDLWGCFTRLSNTSFTEIESYVRLTGNELEPWEIEIIVQLGGIRNNPPESYQWSQK